MHNWPGLPAGEIAISEGASMASADHFEMTVTGRGGHAAMPHQAIDPVLAAAQYCAGPADAGLPTHESAGFLCFVDHHNSRWQCV